MVDLKSIFIEIKKKMNLRFSEYSAQVPRFKNQVSFRSDLSERTRTTWLLQKMGYRNFDDLFDLFFCFFLTLVKLSIGSWGKGHGASARASS